MGKFTSLFKVILVLVAVVGLALLSLKFEFFKPSVSITPDFKYLGQERTITVHAKDRASGLRDMTVSLVHQGKEVTVWHQAFPKPDLLRLTSQKECSCPVTIRPRALGTPNGEVVVKVAVRDWSWWGWLSGNSSIIEKTVRIDTEPPALSLLSTSHIVTAGGSGLVVYRTEPGVTSSGVTVGETFFSGYPKPEGPEGTCVAYFAVPRDATGSLSLSLVARDEAGNIARTGVPNLLKVRKFRTDRIVLSQAFLQTKMPEMMQAHPELKGTLEEVFVQVNHGLRTQNDAKVAQICSRSAAQPLWNGPFLRMKDAAPRALFGDQRIYVYEGKEIDRVAHLGVDLASTEHAPIEAANSGTVVFTGNLGIYGNSVIIDHGQGIFSSYSHLSQITVAAGQSLEKGATIGYSGCTGLAGGDHLHFAMIVGGRFVNPIEWWDPHWIKDNVQLKLS